MCRGPAAGAARIITGRRADPPARREPLPSPQAWVVNAQLFHLKALYGVLSFPWLLLKLPLADALVLALKPTKYNRAGQTVRPATAKERKAARAARLGQVAPV